MVTQVARKAVDQFRAPKKTLGDLNAEAAAKLIAAAADVALIVDAKGIIRDVAFGSEELLNEGLGDWLGKRWSDTVTPESRQKIEELQRDAASGAQPRWRQVNHPAVNGGLDVPIRYSAVIVSGTDKIVAVGRDLRSVSILQQRLVTAQQSVEREYARVRHAESRYRLLFQIASEAVLVVDTNSLRIVEANPAAIELFGKSARRVVGRSFPEMFDTDGSKGVHVHLSAIRSAGRADDAVVKASDGAQSITVSASMFRQDDAQFYLVRLAPVGTAEAAGGNPRLKSKLFDVVEKLPDGFVVADENLRILSANGAFLELAEAASEEQVRGQNLNKWLGRHAADLATLVANLFEHGMVRNFATVMRGNFGSLEDVEVCGVAVATSEPPCIGLTIRNIGGRRTTERNGKQVAARSVEQLTELVGRVSLKELVRESTDMIERLCIEAALELTGDNRASAAEMLGLSRQSLYSKLRRYGLGDLETDTEM